jgi:LysM repeat protein
MTFWAGLFRGMMVLGVWACLSGCTPSGSGPLDEEKEPHFLAGKNRISTMDWTGAIACFDKALQVNPHSASAHFELAWLYDEKEPDPASAIYHYQHFLTERPKAPNADVLKARIVSCKQALAQSVSLGPVTEKVQRQFEQKEEENKRLTEENKHLREELDKWSNYATRLQSLTNQPPPATPNRSAQTTALAQTTPASSSRTANSIASGNDSTVSGTVRTHTVKGGETPFLIAKKYGVKLEALMAANPSVDPRRLKVGQVLRIPGT